MPRDETDLLAGQATQAPRSLDTPQHAQHLLAAQPLASVTRRNTMRVAQDQTRVDIPPFWHRNTHFPCLTNSRHGLQTSSPSIPFFMKPSPHGLHACCHASLNKSHTTMQLPESRTHEHLQSVNMSISYRLAQTKVTVFQFCSSFWILDPSSPSRSIHPILCIFAPSSPAFLTTSP